MKKFTYFFAAFLPFLLALGIQFIAMFFTYGMGVLQLSFDSFTMNDIFELLMNMDINYVMMVIYALIGITVFGMWYYHSCGGDFLPNPSKTFSVLQFSGVVILVPGAQFMCSYLIAILSMIFPSWLEQYEELINSAGLDSSLTVPMFLYAVLFGPICEELIFRGVTMRLSRQALPFWLANIMQAALFGAYHMNWLQGCYAFALGILLGFICEKGGSIYYSILLHILFNFWGTVISELLSGVEDTLIMGILMFVGMLISLAIGSLLFYLGLHQKKAKSSSGATL